MKGFALHTVVIVLLFVGVVGFAGYKVATMDRGTGTETNQSASADAPDTIKNQKDLSNTGKDLDETNAQLDSDLDDTSLDSDLNAVL